ncbi:MAG: TrkH family potassium uptake protein [Clostridia bacterium]|nr:TrkH family potassium uptake protein [Clostridia bacterium]
MNVRLVFRVLGLILLIEAALMLLPCAVALIYGEIMGLNFLWAILIAAAVGFPLSRIPVRQRNMFTRDGFVIVGLAWVMFSLIGCLPFVFSGTIPNFMNAFFETVSGFTTTGASILEGTVLDGMTYCMKFWRCFTNWIGGMGILVFMLALLPLTGGSSVHILRAESTGPTVEKMTPKLSSTAKHLYLIYIGITLAEMLFLLGDSIFNTGADRMPVFDAVVTAIATAGTGGFSAYSWSMMHYSTYAQIVITVFMYLFGINFGLYYLILTGKIKQALKNEELRVFVCMILCAIGVISIDLYLNGVFGQNVGDILRHSAFQVATVSSTTGFASADFNTWPALTKTLMVALMFIGSCAGSTAGGMKMSRIILGFKAARQDIHALIHPRAIKSVRLNGKVVSDEVVNRTVRFLICYLMIFVVSAVIVSLDGNDLETGFTSVAATLNNIGPGLSKVGPTGNYAAFSDLSKAVLILDMLIGRLEVFPMLLLFSPSVWRKGR